MEEVPERARPRVQADEVPAGAGRADRPKVACEGLDTRLFYGDEVDLRQEHPAVKAEREAQAIAVCESCAVRWNCLTWALAQGEEFGVFGGMTAAERKEFKKFFNRVSRRSRSGGNLPEMATKWINRNRKSDGNEEVEDD